MNVEIRVATRKDIEKIALLHAKSWQEIYVEELSVTYLKHDIYLDRNKVWQHRLTFPSANQRIFIATNNGVICGFICFYLNNHPQWGTLIENLHIEKHSKRLGLGKQLLQTAANLSYRQDPDRGMYLEVLASNQAAQDFYKKLGASHTKTQLWQAPDSSEVTEYVYRWKNISHLVQA
ncbi:GNAT family N-acetyltransferase [uncultured Photobacterium sp.]|uniref:GNAT family N-acetyltransferase n=1 Tax=uncultured Photobacterium sp. TaxID=173973 RepID=UPI002615F6EF|nr:GNAT family N-acetyltransferase [uncultured Photobacterium sp.]